MCNNLWKGLLAVGMCFLYLGTAAQNVSINLLTHEAGIVGRNGLLVLEITINNSSATDTVAAFKLRPQVSIPSKLVAVADTGHVMPAGWSIVYNMDGVVRFSNGSDRIAPFEARTILLLLRGVNPGGPATISGNLLFSNGIAPGNASGTATPGDNPADNSSTTTCEVVARK
jgi:hypothetical protein